MLKLENVTKFYHSTSSVTCALRKINLEFKIGEFVAITGESGSGKTTLLNIISGFDTYEEGELYFDNQMTSYFDEGDWEQYRKNEISFIFQNYNLIESYTVLQNVAMTYVLEGIPYKEAKNKAKEKLKLVGLENDLNKKTAKLSGGQKQRLAIARALAKETRIIVADEPTGNLDEENGVKVLEILKKVSKEKLVIVVTHNISQIEPYLTRKVRLHDGEIVLDEIKENSKIDVIQVESKKEVNDYKKILNFSFLNLITQPIKTFLVLSLILLCTISSFVFYGNFKANLDDNKTKELDTTLFQNMDDTRLLVKKNDSSPILKADLDKAYVDNVVSVEKYDYITDINYYRPGDYKFVIDSELESPKDNIMIDYSYYSLIDNSHFMRSSSSLTEDMLKYGRLPENDFEMVVYSTNDKLLDTKETVLFHNEKKMGINVSYKYEVKIVGILKEKTNQVYFSDYICEVLDMTKYNFNISLSFLESYGSGYVSRTAKTSRIVIDPSLSGNQMALGKDLANYLKFEKQIGTNFRFMIDDMVIPYWLDYDVEYVTKISNSAVAVSKEVFQSIYDKITKYEEFALFIDDYVNTNKVIDALIDEGFISLSCFRASVVDYDIDKLVDRYVNLGVSLVALLFINLITIVLVYTIFKLKKNDYLIFKFNGLTNNLSKKINYLDVIIYCVISNIILIIASLIVKYYTQNELIIEIFKQIKFYDYILIFVITMISMIIIANKFTRYLKKFTKITAMRED